MMRATFIVTLLLCSCASLRSQPVAAAPASAICSADGWCWTKPLPQGETIFGAFAFGDRDVWMVGVGGLALHFDGSTWVRTATGTNEVLTAVWGDDPRDLWAAGAHGLILRWNGSAWSEVPSGTRASLLALYGTRDNDVWAAGEAGTVLHWDGAGWRDQSPPGANVHAPSRGYWGTLDLAQGREALSGITVAGGQVIAVGREGGVYRLHDGAWDRSVSGLPGDLQAISGPWAGGEHGIVAWDGTRMIPLPPPSSFPDESVVAIASCQKGEAWAATYSNDLWHFDGRNWYPAGRASLFSLACNGFGFWGGGPGGALAYGSRAGIFATPQSARKEPDESAPRKVWNASPSEAWAIAPHRGSLLRSTGGAWSIQDTGNDAGYRAVSGTGPGDVWAVGEEIAHWDGHVWTHRELPEAPKSGDRFMSSAPAILEAVWSAGRDDVWAAGQGLILHWDGRDWKTRLSLPAYSPSGERPGLPGYGPTSLGNHLQAIAGTSSSDVWVGGWSGALWHWDGSELRQVQSGTRQKIIELRVEGGAVYATLEGGAEIALHAPPPGPVRFEPVPGLAPLAVAKGAP